MDTTTKIKNLLMDAYQHPDRKVCYYSGDSKSTNSKLLDDLEYWDWTPEVSLQVEGNNTCIFPLALGCERIKIEENNEKKEWAKPLFNETDLLTSKELEFDLPDLYSGKSGQLLNNIKQMLPRLKDNEVIRMPDIQSPLGVAEIICGSGLYLALLSNPKVVHKLLDKITTFIIMFIKEVRNICGEKLNGTQFPFIWNDHEGTLCSDDTLSLVSPEMHAIFSLPYVQRIAQEAGPMFYHSCTWKEEYFENIKQISNIRAYNWNPANSIDPKIIIKEFSGRAVLAPHIGPDMHLTEDTKKWGSFNDEAEFMEYILNCMQDNTTLYLWIGAMNEKPEVLEKMYGMLEKRGYTPKTS